MVMNTANNPYNQPPMGQGMMPPTMQNRPQGWQRGMIGGSNAAGRGTSLFPKWLSQYAIGVYLVALAVVSVMYSSFSLPWYYMLSGVVAVLVFFLYGGATIKGTSIDTIRKERNFEKRIFLIAFIPRVLFMLLLYWIFQTHYGDAFGFENADASTYETLGKEVSQAIRDGNLFSKYELIFWGMDLSDRGYGMYLGVVYFISNNSILVARLLKCIWSSITVVLIYRLAKRSFREQMGRISAIFCALWPNFWYYCTCHLKEVEMVFLAVLFVEQADQMLRSRQFTAWKVIPVLLIAGALLTFRTPLALVALLSLVFSVVMSSSKVVNWGKRIIVGVLAVLLIGVTMGNRIEEQSKLLLDAARGGQQQENMDWRSKRNNGNALAKYAGATVFAPMIFTLPFPTMVRPFEGQEVQQLLNGGNFVKNIISCFTIFSMIMLLMSGQWREHLLPLSFMLGYIVVLTMSSFAQAERFHQPAMPFEFMFAAYGLSIAMTKPKYKRWFMYWCGLMFIAVIAWRDSQGWNWRMDC